MAEDAAAYLHKRGHHIYKRVRSPTVGEVLQLTREERNDHDRFAVCQNSITFNLVSVV